MTNAPHRHSSPGIVMEVLTKLLQRTRRYDFTIPFWGDAIAVDGMVEGAVLVGDETCQPWVRDFANNWAGHADQWVSHLIPGYAMLRIFEKTGEPFLLNAALSMAEFFQKRVPRCSKGGPMYRPDLPQWRHTVYVDSLYHMPSFYALLAKTTGDRRWYDASVAEWNGHFDNLITPGRPFLAHAYDTGYERIRGYGWGRGNGWAILGAVDTLELLPADWPGRNKIHQDFNRLCNVLCALQDATGFWRTLLEDREAYLESSTAAFFGAAFTKAMRLGLLPPTFQAHADRAWNAMLSRIDPQGNFHGVSACTWVGTASFDDNHIYRTLPTETNVWGQGSAIRFAVERSLASGDWKRSNA